MRRAHGQSWLDRTASSRGRRVVAATVAAVIGVAGAAAITAFASPSLHLVSSYGPDGDGRTRLVVTVPGGLDDAALAHLRIAPDVDSAQRLFTGSALVAGFGITPAELEQRVPGARVSTSPQGSVTGAPMNDPVWPNAGYNLSNNGSNADPRVSATPVAGDDVNAPAGWAASTGRGQVVAVLDTGMAGHEDLAGALWTNPSEACGSTRDTDGDHYVGDCHGWNFYANSADVTNSVGDASHGTAVAGTVAGRANNGVGLAGVAPGATIMPLVVGSGEGVDLSAAAQAIYYAADHGATVINGSWGGPGGASILSAAISYANSKGVLVVVAAGNDNVDRGTVPMYPASLQAPNLVVVGASTANDTRASFSAYSSTLVDLYAPGNVIVAPWWHGGYMVFNGTSLSSPEVAGAAALYQAVYPQDTPAQIKARILGDATVVPALKGLSVSGARLSLTALGNTAAEVNYSFQGLTSLPGTVSPTVVVNGSSGPGDYAIQLGLGMENSSQVYALTQEPITVGGQTVNTGDDGMATFPLGQLSSLASQVVAPSAPLENGRYVLTAQLFKDGTPVGRTFAAPLLVSDSPAPSTPTPGIPDPSSGPQPSTDPGTQPGSSTPGSGTQPGTQPGSTDPGTQPGSTTPGNGTQPGSQPGSTDPGTGTQPGSTPPGSGTQPGTQPGSQPGATDPGTGSQPAPVDPGSGSQPVADPTNPSGPGNQPLPVIPSNGSQPGSSAPGGDSPTVYPGTDVFKVTSVNPSTVSTSGGTLITIIGTALPANARVRVGPNTGATVLAGSATQVTFVAPPMVVGIWNVTVFAVDGTSSELRSALTYVAPSSDGSQPGTNPGGSTSPPGATDPGATGPGSTDPGATDPGNSNPGSSTPGVVTPDSSARPIVGPHKERLMYSALFAGLGTAIWGVNCSSACSGLAV